LLLRGFFVSKYPSTTPLKIRGVSGAIHRNGVWGSYEYRNNNPTSPPLILRGGKSSELILREWVTFPEIIALKYYSLFSNP